MASDPLPEPWRSFLQDLDTQLVGPTELHLVTVLTRDGRENAIGLRHSVE